jgi:hypothetical protein
MRRRLTTAQAIIRIPESAMRRSQRRGAQVFCRAVSASSVTGVCIGQALQANPDFHSVIQRILRHSTVATTQNHYIKTASPDAIAAIRQFSEALLCSTCAPQGQSQA